MASRASLWRTFENTAFAAAKSDGDGAPLPAIDRGAMEARFAYDFGKVRIHAASGAAAAVGAKAFTIGTHIWFRPGRGPSDHRLLAHELEHVVQQSTGAATHLREENGFGPLRDDLESRARRRSDRSGAASVANRPLPAPSRDAPIVQFDFESDVLAELHRMPSAEAEGISGKERRARVAALAARVDKLRDLFADVSAADAANLEPRLSRRIAGDVLSERFHDILSTPTRKELVGILVDTIELQAYAQHQLVKVLKASEGIGFCTPSTKEEIDDEVDFETMRDMETFVNEDLRDVYGDEVANLFDQFLTRVQGDSLDPVVLDDPTDEIVQAFAKDPATAQRRNAIVLAITKALPSKCPALIEGAWVDVDVTTLLPASELDAPFTFTGATPPTIPGLIAGGVGSSVAGPDRRSVTGTVQLLRTTVAGGAQNVQMRTNLRFSVVDAIHFCGGNPGNAIARIFTTPLSRLEASNMAYTVPFRVDYTAPSITVFLPQPVASACP